MSEVNFDYELAITAFEDAPLGILFMEDLKIININKYALDMMEYKDKEELIGKNPSVLSPNYQPNGKSSIEYSREMFGKAVEEGMNEFEWVHMSKTGTKKWFKVILKRMSMNSMIFIAYWEEITKAKMYEQRFTSFMNNLPAAVYIKNDELKYTYMNNHARTLLEVRDGFSLEERDYDVTNILEGEALERVIESDNLVLSTGSYDESYISFKVKDKDTQCFRNIKFQFQDVDYKNYIGGILLDISELAKATKRNENMIDSLIETIQLITEARDPYTSGHEHRVSDISVEIGKRYGLDENQLEGLRIGALIHDIGKIQVPLEILNKPGTLSRNEFNLVKDHAQIGANLIESLDVDWPIKEIIQQHHERINGSGYPKGLSGEKILIEARIICVADTVEAMSSHRPYRPAKSKETVIQQLIDGKGKLYDSQVTDICLELIEEGIVTL